MIATLDAHFPVALLPVRIETRFMNDATELRIRIYPDPLHIDTHEPGLTPGEVEAGHAYWNERWAAPADAARTRTMWTEMARRFGPRRALWIVQNLTPDNIDVLGGATPPTFPSVPGRSDSWTRAAYAALLPTQWVAIGLRGGAEIFRKAGAPLPDTLVVGPDPNAPDEPIDTDGIALDEAMRWIADYDTAVASGMGITIAETDTVGGLSGGLDQLIVLGVNASATPEQSALAMADLLRAHLYTDGLGVVRPESPTNNTEAARAGDADPFEAQTRALDPTLLRTLDGRSAGPLVAQAMGLDTAAVDFTRVPDAETAEQRTASLLFDVLWLSTLGYYLDQMLEPLVDDATIRSVRSFVRTHLQPGGPLPVIRTGRQPYGVLPIVAPSRFQPTDAADIDGRVHAMLQRLRPFWTAAVRDVPRLGTTDDPDTELLQLLQMVPLSALARFRRVIGPELEPNIQGLEKHALAQQYYATLITRVALGWMSAPRIASFTADPRDHPLRVPWVQKDLPLDGALLEPDYLTTIAQAARADGGRATLDARDNNGSLLEALVANAALHELDAAAARVVIAHEMTLGTLRAAPARMAFRAPETVRIDGPTPAPSTPGVAGNVRVDTPRELNDLVLPATTGSISIGTWIATRIRGPVSNLPSAIGDLASFLTSLDELATRPAAEIDRALRGVLDSFSHRLDAWYTALASARLDAMRKQQPLGIHIGGYGWVEDLHPDVTPDSLGYVHAPSLEQASAAAILRSGHLAHRDDEHQTMNIDLRSDRVRLALTLLEGVATAQPLAALLGYRLERSLRDRDPRLARFIAPLRRIAPLRPPGDAAVTQPAESIAARDVVDGVALLEKRRAGEDAILNAIAVSGSERIAVSEELARLADALDAVSDLLVAESVYQTTAGNPERARAALAVLDRQERPVEPQVVRTPRTGNSYAQRLFILLNEDVPPSAWSRLADARSAAEPRLNAWIARQLGNPASYRFTGRITTDNKPPRDVDATLRQLDLSPLSLMMAARRVGPEAASELEERIATEFAAAVEADDQNPRVEIDADSTDPGSGQIGLGPLLVLLEWIGTLSAQRPANARDLAPADQDVAAGIDAEEITARADAAVAEFDDASADLEAALGAGRPSERTLRKALGRASAAGALDAIPRAIVSPNGAKTIADTATILASLLDLGAVVVERMRGTRISLDALDAMAGAAAGSAASLADHQIARIRTIFGKDFPVLPCFSPANAVDLAASLADQDALCGGDTLAPATWLQRMSLVRPETDALQRVLTAADLLSASAGTGDLRIAQLPHIPGQRWVALPQDPGTTISADLALAFHTPATIDFTVPVAAIVCDDWSETIPSAQEVTGLSFHYDAPGARAPNAILLAVPANLQSSAWSFDELLDVVREAGSLAKIRMVGPRQLDALGILLPTTYLPENFRHDVPSVNVGKLTASVGIGSMVMGKATT
jgi:hypothetical protein